MATAGSTTAQAQTISQYFPEGAAGYGEQLGVTVQSRLRPLYDNPGVRLGAFLVRPGIDESLFYNSNINGIANSGGWGLRTSASVSAGSNWVRNGLGASVGVDRYRFFSAPSQDYTDWNLGIGGGYSIADSQLRLGYGHRSYNLLGTSIAGVRTQTPLLVQVDSARIGYSFNLSRFTVTPDLDASAYRFGTATVLGIPSSQRFLDRNVVGGGVTVRYSMSDEGGLLAVLRGVNSNYINPQPGQPSNDSTSILLLGGIDYQAKSVWRYRLLAGMEVRAFAASQYGTKQAPIVEGSVIWTPTGLTTLTGTVSRQIQGPLTLGNNGYVLNQARLVVDHEYRRNVFLQGRGGILYVEYLQGGAQTNVSVGAGVSWLLNRNLRLSADYNFAAQTSGGSSGTLANPNTLRSGRYNQSIFALTVRFAL